MAQETEERLVNVTIVSIESDILREIDLDRDNVIVSDPAPPVDLMCFIK